MKNNWQIVNLSHALSPSYLQLILPDEIPFIK